MNSGTQNPDTLFDYEVLDTAGKKIGTVDGVWVDDATSELEFVGVKTGWLMGKTHIIPATNAQIGDHSISVPYEEQRIKDAPSFGTDAELTPDQENEIYSYYGMDRSTAPSPTGLPTGDTGTATGYAAGEQYAGGDQYATADRGVTGNTVAGDSESVQLAEEQLQVGKREVEAGRLRMRKVVRTERVEQPIDLRHEEVQVERVDATGATVPGDAFQERDIEVPVMREEPVVAKEAVATGEVRVGKTASTETRTVGDEVRKEDVEVDRDIATDQVTGRNV